jgi:RNA polymerase sigma factor (sigma-70 family)
MRQESTIRVRAASPQLRGILLADGGHSPPRAMDDRSDHSSLSDEQCLARHVASQEPGAFEQLVERHLGTVRAACVDALGHRHPYVDDACQAVFLILARRASEIRAPAALGAWLRSTARGVSANIRRAEQRRHAREGALAAQAEEICLPEEPEERLSAQLELAIGALSSRQREAVIHHFFLGKRQAQIAQELGVSEGAVKKRISDAMGCLRTFFAQRELTMPSLLVACSLPTTGVSPGLMHACCALSRGHGSPAVEALCAPRHLPLQLATMLQGLASLAALCALAWLLIHHPAMPKPPMGAEHAATTAALRTLPAIHPPLPQRPEVAEAFLAPIRALRQNDLHALLRALPRARRAQIEHRWQVFAATPSPGGDQLADAGLTWARGPSASTLMPLLYRPLTSDLQNALAGISDAERRAGRLPMAHLLNAVRYDLAAYCRTLDLYDHERVRLVAEHTRATVSVWPFTSVADFRRTAFPTVVSTCGQALRSLKRWYLPYGLQVDRVLDSFRVVQVVGPDSHPQVEVALTVCDQPHLLWVSMQRTSEGDWECPQLEELLESSFQQLSHYFYLPDRPAARAAAPDAPLPNSRPPDDADAHPELELGSPRTDG